MKSLFGFCARRGCAHWLQCGICDQCDKCCRASRVPEFPYTCGRIGWARLEEEAKDEAFSLHHYQLEWP